MLASWLWPCKHTDISLLLKAPPCLSVQSSQSCKAWLWSLTHVCSFLIRWGIMVWDRWQSTETCHLSHFNCPFWIMWWRINISVFIQFWCLKTYYKNKGNLNDASFLYVVKMYSPKHGNEQILQHSYPVLKIHCSILTLQSSVSTWNLIINTDFQCFI